MIATEKSSRPENLLSVAQSAYFTGFLFRLPLDQAPRRLDLSLAHHH
jgi:hypothetical protein